jgi:hypothetical protein
VSGVDLQPREERIWDAEDEIMGEVNGLPVTTDDLIVNLKARQFDEYSIRAAIWALIGRGDLLLRSERGDVFVVRPA